MCRYAMALYKPHYACFGCRKTFKRRLMWDINRDDKRLVEAKCPQCCEMMANMGLDFASPKKDNIKKWEHLKRQYSVGITFHSCGCSGPGYIPNDDEMLISYFQKLLGEFNSQLTFWRERIEPANEKEIHRENSKSWDFLQKVPFVNSPKKGAISNEEAKKHWFEKIKQIEIKLALLTNSYNK